MISTTTRNPMSRNNKTNGLPLKNSPYKDLGNSDRVFKKSVDKIK